MKQFEPRVSKIISKDNKLYRDCIKLSQKKYRDSFGAMLVEGENLVSEAVALGKAVLILYDEKVSLPEEYRDVPSVAVKSSLFTRLTDTKNDQGIVCVVERPKKEKTRFFRVAGSAGTNILILDRLQDPGNAGTLVRTAEAAGYAGIITVKGSADLFSPKVVRAAAGSILRVPVYEAEDASEVAEMAAVMRKRLVATVPVGGVMMDEADLESDICLIVGNEGNGISEELLELADEAVMIPMMGEVESLNAAVAAAVIMYRSIGSRK